MVTGEERLRLKSNSEALMNELRSSDPDDEDIEEDILNLLRAKFQDEDSNEDIDCEAFTSMVNGGPELNLRMVRVPFLL